MMRLWVLFPCIAADLLNVHIVSHTHDDVGWLKTVDQYYAGLNNSIQHAYVHMILDTVIRCLELNPNRTFTYVEQAFFQRWWREQDASVRELTKRLVKNGQLEFTNGGWCMHDEAAPHYLDMIDQTTLGHKFLMEEFGVFPKTGWQLDPFGHSSTQAALLSAEVGFEGLFFGRIDYQDLNLRREQKAAEFIWRASPSLGKAAQVFSGLTGEYGGNYGPPSGFNWDVHASDTVIQDDPDLEDYNVKERVDEFVKRAMQMSADTRGKNIMLTMGSDFEYEDAFEWFYNLDKIIKYANEDGRVKVFYSTPSRYVAAKAAEMEVSWPLKEDDFFPYADGPHKFWTGYFTSRPALKRYIRDTSGFYQAVKQMEALSEVSVPGLEHLAEAMGVAQHHDAVSGTAKQHVTFDYAKRLSEGRAASAPVVSAALRRLSLSHMTTAESIDFEFCELRNVSQCVPTQQVGQDRQQTCFAVWNGLAHGRTELVELPVVSEKLSVVDASGAPVKFQLQDSLPSVSNYGPASGAPLTLIFAADLPALGSRSFCLQATDATAQRTLPETNAGCVVLENDFLALDFCNGSLASITDKVSKITTKAVQSWLWYRASVGNKESDQASGAYVFRPNKSEASAIPGQPAAKIVRGPLADEVHQNFGPWISQRVRLAKGARHVEFTYTVGEIPVEDNIGKEIITRITTSIDNKGACFSDSNGREMLSRQRDYRPTWKLNQTEEVAGNYFPVTTALFIRDQGSQLTLLTDTSQAGTGCIHDGEIEVMVHRRLLKDDSRGVGEPLNETEYVTPYWGLGPFGAHRGRGLVIRGQHFLTFTPPATAASHWRPLMDRLYLPAMPFFQKSAAAGSTFSGIRSMPENLELLTLSRWDEESVLLRIGHKYGIDEDAELSKPVDLDLSSVFAAKLIEVNERGLAGTISRKEVLTSRINWKVEGEPEQVSQEKTSVLGQTIYAFGPLQIRTFFVKFEPTSGPLFV